MSKLTEHVTLGQEDIEAAVQDWLAKKYPNSPTTTEWRLQLRHSRSTTGQGWAECDTDHFSASASRDVE